MEDSREAIPADPVNEMGLHGGRVPMQPFDDYPGGGRTMLRKMGRTNARREDGLWLMNHAGQSSCAYCGLSLVDDYNHWLLLNVDHVIPVKECERLRVPAEWHHSFANAVLACSGCNMFDNHFTVSWEQPREGWEESGFIDLRDKVFQERVIRIQSRRQAELFFFDSKIKR